MRVALQVLFIVVVLAAAGAATLWLIDQRPELEATPIEVPVPLVEVLVTREQPFRRTVHGRGEVAPREEIVLVSEVDGRVAALSPALVSGGRFTAGQVLVELETADLGVARTRAAAALQQAETALQRERAEAQVARRHYAELGRGEASALALRLPQVDEAEARVAAAAADLARADRDLERARLAAPFDGRVRSESVAVGQLVTRGQVLAELFASDLAEVRVPVPDADLAHLDLARIGLVEDGPSATLSASFGGARREWPGRVLRVEGEVDRTSRMVTLVVGVLEPYGRAADQAGAPLMPGLFVDVTIEGREEPQAVLLPRAALRDQGRIYVVDDQQRLRFRPVVLSWKHGERVLVSAGLVAGEQVCVSPLAAAVDGMRVRVAETPASAGGAEPGE